jgi:hypothetical protein
MEARSDVISLLSDTFDLVYCGAIRLDVCKRSPDRVFSMKACSLSALSSALSGVNSNSQKASLSVDRPYAIGWKARVWVYISGPARR